MRKIFLHVEINDSHDEIARIVGNDGELPLETADRVADELINLLRAAKVSARILPLRVYQDDDEEGISCGNEPDC